jgi:hypothetical protein
MGQNRLFRNTGKGTFEDVTAKSGLGGREAFSTSAMWVDYDRDGLLDLFVCNYVRWSQDVRAFLSMMARLMMQLRPMPTLGRPAASFSARSSRVS